MNTIRAPRWLLLAAGCTVLLLLLAACGGGGGDEPSAEGDQEDAAPTDGDAGEEGGAATAGLRVAYASDLDPNDIADQIGIQEAGAEILALTEDSAVVAGLRQDEFQIGNIDLTAAIKAIQGGVPLKIVYVAQNTPEFVMVAQSDITELTQLEGKTVAYHSPGSLTEILQRELIRENAPELEDQIDWTVLPESPNRAAAMVAGRIDATTLEFLDVYALQQQGDFNILGSWGDLSGDSAAAIATAWVVTEDYLAENRDVVQAFLEHVQAGYDSFYSDEDAWLSLATETLPDVDEGALEEAYDYYVDVEMYPQTGEPPITEERWQGLDGFFRQIGEYEQEAPIDMVDLDMVGTIAGG